MSREKQLKRQAQYGSADGALQTRGPEFSLYAKPSATLNNQCVRLVRVKGNDLSRGFVERSRIPFSV